MMKILIGYDGSIYADSALDDLVLAGLPPEVEAVVLTVADVWVPSVPPISADRASTQPDLQIQARAEELRQQSDQALGEAMSLAVKAVERIQTTFPLWKVIAQTRSGSPAFEIIKEADEWRPGLVIVGSHGHTALGRLLLGSVSQKVVNETQCSVRVARERTNDKSSPLRILVAFDGSDDALTTIKTIARRNWLPETKFRIITADDDPSSRPEVSPIDYMPGGKKDSEAGKAWISKMIETPVQILETAGLNVTQHIKWGGARSVVLDEAEDWKADMIFVGARGLGRFKRLLLGSVSSAVAARAKCSVEVVRGFNNSE